MSRLFGGLSFKEFGVIWRVVFLGSKAKEFIILPGL